MFTGLATDEHGWAADRWTLRDVDAPTVAERLSERGYATIAASANPWIGPGFGFDRGFDTFLEGWRVGSMPDLTTASLRSGALPAGERIRRVAAAGPAAVATAIPAAALPLAAASATTAAAGYPAGSWMRSPHPIGPRLVS